MTAFFYEKYRLFVNSIPLNFVNISVEKVNVII